MNKELLEIRADENNEYVKQLEQARDKLNNKRELSEFDLPTDDRNDFINILNKFIEGKLQIGYSLQQEDEQGLTFYEEELRVYEFKPRIEDFDELPITEQERADLDNLLTDKQEDYLENENSERYYNKKYGEEILR